ncbi:hypothetical protein [Flavobacterium sp.]|uniref:hypothetical protein n=1 Tax=Flavobacterium sp. TaxID=239 RepID=UPI0032649B6E
MKKFTIFLTIFSLYLICSCGQKKPNVKVSEGKIIKKKSVIKKEIESEQRHYFDSTFVVNKQTFKFIINDINEEEITLTFFRNTEKIKVDTIQSGGLGGVEFVDFNKDKNIDILLTYIGNNPSYDLYLFDKSENKYKFLDGYNRFSEAKQLKANPKYYFSYQRAGCADMNWVSDLFYIDNYKTVHVGHIYGQGCTPDEKENPLEIEIYKIYKNDDVNKTLIEKLPYTKNIPKFDQKWMFIEKYWNKNYGKFN